MSRRKISDQPIRYVIATHSWLDGAKLSKRGHWGNIPYPDEEAAEKAAREDAGDHPFRLEWIAVRR